MGEKIKTVMVYENREPSESLGKVLKRLGMEVRHVRTCREAFRLFKEPDAVELVFTDTALPDGTWQDILRLGLQTHAFLPVIVVSGRADSSLQFQALESGTFDFVTPPFLSLDLASISGSAVYMRLTSRDMRPARVA